MELLLDGSLRGEVAEATGRVGVAPSLAALVPRNPSVSSSAAIEAQATRMRRVQKQLEEHPLHLQPCRQELLNSSQLEEELVDEERRLRRKMLRTSDRRGFGEGNGGIDEGDESAVKDVEHELDGGKVWRQFLEVGTLLREFGALEGWEATELGELVGSLSCDNELWLALVLTEAAATPLSAAQLAAVLLVTLNEHMRPNSFVAFSASRLVLGALHALAGHAASLDEAQFVRGLNFPVSLEPGACALVEV